MNPKTQKSINNISKKELIKINQKYVQFLFIKVHVWMLGELITGRLNKKNFLQTEHISKLT